MDQEKLADQKLERMAELYSHAHAEWKRDQANPFKDGKFLACEEGIRLARLLAEEDGDGLSDLYAAVSQRFEQARRAWMQDRTNPFKDGCLMGFYEFMALLQEGTSDARALSRRQ